MLSTPFLLRALCGLAVATWTVGCTTLGPPAGFERPDQGRVELSPVARVEPAALNELSGMVGSRRHPGIFWVHNDSGDRSRIFALRADGSAAGDPEGIAVEGVINRDWEGIGIDANQNLLIADTGNNFNRRRDLTVYVIPEPNPSDRSARAIAVLPFFYPDQERFPPEQWNYDCEAIFAHRGSIYLLTKHRGDRSTRLFRLNPALDGEIQPAQLARAFSIGGQVTGADIDPDNNRLAVLTYNAIWVFEPPPDDPEGWFTGEARWLPIRARQAEAVAWLDSRTLLVANEQRGIYRVPLRWLTRDAREVGDRLD